MLDWSTLQHADGSAADVPQRLAQMTPDSNANVWAELWSLLCHQGTVYSASFAALPALLEAAERWNPRDRAQAITLASSILAYDDVYGGRREDFVRPVDWVYGCDNAFNMRARRLSLKRGCQETISSTSYNQLAR